MRAKSSGCGTPSDGGSGEDCHCVQSINSLARFMRKSYRDFATKGEDVIPFHSFLTRTFSFPIAACLTGSPPSAVRRVIVDAGT
jgi:hypothetical protein